MKGDACPCRLRTSLNYDLDLTEQLVAPLAVLILRGVGEEAPRV